MNTLEVAKRLLAGEPDTITKISKKMKSIEWRLGGGLRPGQLLTMVAGPSYTRELNDYLQTLQDEGEIYSFKTTYEEKKIIIEYHGIYNDDPTTVTFNLFV